MVANVPQTATLGMPTRRSRGLARLAARRNGFTLIEVMIVAAVIAILTTIALPSYSRYVMKSRRAAAASFVLGAANLESQVMLDLRRYVSVADNAAFINSPTAGSPGLKTSVPASVADFYNVSIVATATPSFTITAAPKGAQAADTACGSLMLDHTGAKTVSGSAGVAACW